MNDAARQELLGRMTTFAGWYIDQHPVVPQAWICVCFYAVDGLDCFAVSFLPVMKSAFSSIEMDARLGDRVPGQQIAPFVERRIGSSRNDSRSTQQVMDAFKEALAADGIDMHWMKGTR